MRRLNTELILKNSLKFTQSWLNNSSVPATGAEQAEILPTEIQETDFIFETDCFGGIVKKSQLGWLARGPLFEVFSLKNGQKISSFRFDLNLGFERCIVTCVAEIDIVELNFCVLAVCIQLNDTPGGLIVLCSVQELSKIFRCIEIKQKITSCHYIKKDITKRTVLQMFSGCLAIGTDSGNVILLDLDVKKCEEALFSAEDDEADIELVSCCIVENNLDFRHLRQCYQQSKHENVHFGIQLDVIDDANFILSIISILNILSLAVGLEDGRLILFDLSELQISYIINPPSSCKSLPLVKLTYIEPADDPRACIYLWAFHEGQEPSAALMYSIMHENRITEDDGTCLFENFQTCNLRLTLNTSDNGGIPIACQSIFKQSSNGDENTLSLCLLAWKQRNTTRLLLYDMNQWYKEQMPHFSSLDGNDSYLASFTLKDCNVLDIYIDPNSVTSFNSIQQYEEHFYPISLSFDCIHLHQNGCSVLHWPGLQNRGLELLKSGGALAILEPTPYFDEIIHASLMPQFCGKSSNDYRRLSSRSQYSDDGVMDTSGILQNYNLMFSINDQRNILLSVALEYNCFGLLKECAICWADGSHLGKRPFEGLSLSTLTEWIWKRANIIKKRCNTLCVPLFDHSGRKIDRRSKKEIAYLLRQLKSLADLMEIILKRCREYIPSDVFELLSSQYQSIRIASDYQEVVYWLLNVGLLPEGVIDSGKVSNFKGIWSQSNLVPYPYKALKDYYTSKRKCLGQVNKSSVCNRTGSCRILYIDAFIEHECSVNMLRDHWIECGGNGLYPPSSLQAMLRAMLIPDIPLENKYILFIYLFLDLNMIVECERHAAIVQNLIKFPAVFKLNASLTKTVQAFWNLDHGQFEMSLEELISPFAQDRKLPQWQKELLVETLLTQDQPNLALRALQTSSTPISTLLELKTMLSNDLIAEAFHLQRTKNDAQLFRQFLTGCLCLGKLGVLRDLAFTEDESKILDEFLKDVQSSKAENLHFVHLLEKSKYIEAISYLDELSHNKRYQNQNQCYTNDLETPNLVLSAYNSTMTPATKQLADLYYGIRSKIKPKDLDSLHPLPLSSQLFQQNANKLAGGIYHSSILSADQATIYWDENIYKQRNRLLNANNTAFIRAPQSDIVPVEIGICRDSVSYPEIYKNSQKRKLNESDLLLNHANSEIDDIENPEKRRKTTCNQLSLENQNLNKSLLTKFKNNTIAKDFNNVEKTIINSIPRQNFTNKISHTLNTPIVKSIVDFRDECDSADERISRRTPQSILKSKSHGSRTPAKGYVKRKLIIDKNGSQETVETEEKSLRFDLPEKRSSSHQESLSVLSNKNSDGIEEDELKIEEHKEQLGVEEDELEYSTILKHSVDTYSGPQKRKPLRRSRGILLSTSVDGEDYYSPHSLKDVSRVSESDLNEKDEENTSTPLWVQTKKNCGEHLLPMHTLKINYQHFDVSKTLDGPKARRPLRINKNKSPSEKGEEECIIENQSCAPPDRSLLTSRKSGRLQNKLKQTSDKETLESKLSSSQLFLEFQKPSLITRSQQKSSSRMVLETNTMENFSEKIIKETMTSTTTVVSKKIVEDTFVVEEPEIVEKSEITFEPQIASSRFLESSTPVCKEQRSLEECSSSMISLSCCADTQSMNLSSEYSSAIERSQTEDEVTVVRTATVTVFKATAEDPSATKTMTNSSSSSGSSLLTKTDAIESNRSELSFEEFSSPKSSNDFREKSIEDDLSDENQINNVKDRNYESNLSSSTIDHINNEDHDKFSISSSLSLNEDKIAQFFVENDKEQQKNYKKNNNNIDEVVSISSDSDCSDIYVDTKVEDDEIISDAENILKAKEFAKDEDKKKNAYISGEDESQFFDDDNDNSSDELRSVINERDSESDDGNVINSENKNTETTVKSPLDFMIEYANRQCHTQQSGATIEAGTNCKQTESISQKQQSFKLANNSEQILTEVVRDSKSVLNYKEIAQESVTVTLEELINKNLEGKNAKVQASNEKRQVMNFLTGEEESIEESLHLIIKSGGDVDESKKIKVISSSDVDEGKSKSTHKFKPEVETNNDSENSIVPIHEGELQLSIELDFKQISTNQKELETDERINRNRTLEADISFGNESKMTLQENTAHGKTKKTINNEQTEIAGTTTNKNDHITSAKKRKLFPEQDKQIENSVINETPTKRVTRGRRARSESIDIDRESIVKKATTTTAAIYSPVPNRLTRAKSVSNDTPPTAPNRILTRRQSFLNRIEEDSVTQIPSRSAIPTTPNRILTRRQSALLDRIEEDSHIESPLSRTKSLKILDMVGSEVKQTQLTKRTRKSSIGTDDPCHSVSKSTRSSSVLAEDNYPTPKKGQAVITSIQHQSTPITEEFRLKVLDRERREERAKKIKTKKLDAFDSETSDEEMKSENKFRGKQLDSAQDVTTSKGGKSRKMEKSMEPEGGKIVDKKHVKSSKSSSGLEETEQENRQQEPKINRKKEKSVEPENKKKTSKYATEKSHFTTKENVEEEEINEKKMKSRNKREKSTESEMQAIEKIAPNNDNDEIAGKVRNKTRKKEKLVEPKSSKRQTESHESTIIESENDEEQNKSKIIKSSKRRENRDDAETSMFDDYSTSRRLTRGQQAAVLIRKSTVIESPRAVESPARKRSTKSEENSIADSETESIGSTRSKRTLSSRAGVSRQTRRSMKNDETSSIGSSVSIATNKTGKSAESKSKHLKTITEEDKSENESLVSDDTIDGCINRQSPRKKGRPRKLRT